MGHWGRHPNNLIPPNRSWPARAQVNMAQKQTTRRLTATALRQHTLVQASTAPVTTTSAMKMEESRANMIRRTCLVRRNELCNPTEVGGSFYKFHSPSGRMVMSDTNVVLYNDAQLKVSSHYGISCALRNEASYSTIYSRLCEIEKSV